MKRIVTLSYMACLLALMSCQDDWKAEVPRDNAPTQFNAPNVVKGEAYIKFDSMDNDLNVVATRSGVLMTEHPDLDAAIRELGITRLERMFPYAGRFEERTRRAGLHLWYKVAYNKELDPNEVARTLSNVSGIESVDPVVIPTSCTIPNDPYWGGLWYLYSPNTPDADIDILEAWEETKGNKEVIVAVVDAPVFAMHEDLRDNMWVNQGEYNQNPNEDNDKNGYVGDWWGYNVNYYNGGMPPQNLDGAHGTHVAGIIGAKNNNGKGVCGVAGGDDKNNGVRIMTCDFSEPIQAIKYAADMGAVICTNSYHFDNLSPESRRLFQEAVNYFVEYAGVDEKGNQTGPMRGGIVLAAAGNDNKEPEPEKMIPASLDNVIAVAATSPQQEKSVFSNWADWVDISAPGEQIYSTVADQAHYGRFYYEASGTSQATPVVAGVAALIVSKFGCSGQPGLKAEEVVLRLLRGVTPIKNEGDYAGKLGAGIVNAKLALSDAPVNDKPKLVFDKEQNGQYKKLPKQTICYYGDKVQYVYTVSDREDSVDELEYSVNDPSHSVTLERKGDILTVTINNTAESKPGDHLVTLTVTDKGLPGVENSVLSCIVSFNIKLLPERKQEVEVASSVKEGEPLLIHAGINFSGAVTVRLYNATGSLVLEKQLHIALGKPGELDLSGFAGGCYTLKMTCNNKTIIRNIIKL